MLNYTIYRVISISPNIRQTVEAKVSNHLVDCWQHLDFNPQVPVVYYESRIQNLRRHGYSNKAEYPKVFTENRQMYKEDADLFASVLKT